MSVYMARHVANAPNVTLRA